MQNFPSKFNKWKELNFQNILFTKNFIETEIFYFVFVIVRQEDMSHITCRREFTQTHNVPRTRSIGIRETIAPRKKENVGRIGMAIATADERKFPFSGTTSAPCPSSLLVDWCENKIAACFRQKWLWAAHGKGISLVSWAAILVSLWNCDFSGSEAKSRKKRFSWYWTFFYLFGRYRIFRVKINL